jgi:hypothetical protein
VNVGERDAPDELVGAVSHDRERPSLEFYRRRDEVVLLLPIRG